MTEKYEITADIPPEVYEELAKKAAQEAELKYGGSSPVTVNQYITIINQPKEVKMGDNYSETNTGQIGAKSTGRGSSAVNTGSLQFNPSTEDKREAQDLLNELRALIESTDVPNQDMQAEAASDIQAASSQLDYDQPDEGVVKSKWEKIKGYTNGLIAVGSFAAEKAERAVEVVKKISVLFGG